MVNRRPRGRRRALLRDRSGQALVEFAFVLLMMIALILGMIDFARLYLQYQVATDAAREAARRAVKFDQDWASSSDIYDGILGFLSTSGINTSDAAPLVEQCGPASGSPDVVTIFSCNWNGARNSQAEVRILIPFEFALVGPFIGWATGDRSITLRTSAIMRNE